MLLSRPVRLPAYQGANVTANPGTNHPAIEHSVACSNGKPLHAADILGPDRGTDRVGVPHRGANLAAINSAAVCCAVTPFSERRALVDRPNRGANLSAV